MPKLIKLLIKVQGTTRGSAGKAARWKISRWEWWHWAAVPAFGKERQEDWKFKGILQREICLYVFTDSEL